MLWISMRFIGGDTAAGALSAYVDGIPPERAVHIIEKVAAALDFAHRKQVVHRDVKPANILLTDRDDDDAERVYLTDFGVAKAIGESRCRRRLSPPPNRSRASPSTAVAMSTLSVAC